MIDTQKITDLIDQMDDIMDQVKQALGESEEKPVEQMTDKELSLGSVRPAEQSAPLGAGGGFAGSARPRGM